MRKITYIVLLLFVCMSVCAQVYVRTYNYDEVIKTVRVVTADDIADGNQLQPQRPFLFLTSDAESIDGSEPSNTLHISFDQMSYNVHFYSYTVVHMNAERTQPSDLMSTEYLKGFTTQDITNYEHSLNTAREYTHYWFTFPNEDMQLTKSGNYRLMVYEDGDRDRKVLDVDFCVAEQSVAVTAQVRTTTDIEFNGRYQQMDFDLTSAVIDWKNPDEIKVLVRQNNRTDNEVWVSRPTYVEPKRLRYINCKELIFEGGNNYHHFDAFSAYYAGTGIDRVFFEGGDYHVMLFADEIAKGSYTHVFDSDGQFIVNAERTSSPDTEAEYMWVHWMLPMANPWLDGALYVGGDMFNNELQLPNRMQYDVEHQCYWLTALVKQGGYDYQYWFKGKGTQNKTTTQRVDGSYWQTDNHYNVYVYWRPFGARYDRLVALTP